MGVNQLIAVGLAQKQSNGKWSTKVNPEESMKVFLMKTIY